MASVVDDYYKYRQDKDRQGIKLETLDPYEQYRIKQGTSQTYELNKGKILPKEQSQELNLRRQGFEQGRSAKLREYDRKMELEAKLQGKTVDALIEEVANSRLDGGGSDDLKRFGQLLEARLQLRNEKFNEDIDLSGAKLYGSAFERGIVAAGEGARATFGATNPYIPYKTERTKAYEAERSNATGARGVFSDLSYSTGNMLPSVVIGMVPGAEPLALASTAITSGGSNYLQAKNEMGLSEDQAKTYGILTGLSEAALQKVMGGINPFGKSVLGSAASKYVSPVLKKAIAPAAEKMLTTNIGKATAKLLANKAFQMVAKQAGKSAEEFFEEYSQQILQPVYKNIAVGDPMLKDFKLYTPEALYAGFLGSLSSLAINTADAASKKVPSYIQSKLNKATIDNPYSSTSIIPIKDETTANAPQGSTEAIETLSNKPTPIQGNIPVVSNTSVATVPNGTQTLPATTIQQTPVLEQKKLAYDVAIENIQKSALPENMKAEFTAQLQQDYQAEVKQLQAAPSVLSNANTDIYGEYADLSDDHKEMVKILSEEGTDIDTTIKDFESVYNEYINDYVKELQDSGHKGVKQGYLHRKDTGEVIGRSGRESNNPTWYRKYYAEHGKAPGKKALRNIAIDHLRNGYTDEQFGDMEPDQNFIEMESVINAFKDIKAKRTGAATSAKQSVSANIRNTQQNQEAKPTTKAVITSKSDTEYSSSNNADKQEYNTVTTRKGGKRQRKFQSTVAKNENVVNKEVQKTIDAYYKLGALEYTETTNKKDLDKANTILERVGVDEALSQLREKIDTNQRLTATDIMLGQRLIQEVNKNGNTQETMKVINDLAVILTEMGQSIQAVSAILKLSPEGRLMTLQRVAERANKKFSKEIEADSAKAKAAEREINKGIEASANETVSDIFDSVAEEPVKAPAKKGENTQKKNDPSQKLARKIIRQVDTATSESKVNENQAIDDMVKELYQMAQESDMPRKPIMPKSDPISFLKQALDNKAEYAETWQKAKEIVAKKYAGNTVILEMLDAYFDKGVPPTYSERTIKRTVKSVEKDLKLKLVEALTKSQAEKVQITDIGKMDPKAQAATIKDISDIIIKETGATEADATQLSEQIMKQYMEVLKKNGVIRLQKKFSLLNKKIVIPDAIAADILNQTTPEELDAAMQRAIESISAQMPSTIVEKINAWRYLSMLSAPKTHGKNIGGNATMYGLRNVKDLIGTGLEKWLVKDHSLRTKSTFSRTKDKALFDVAKTEFKNEQEKLRSYSKFSLDQKVNLLKKVFPNKTLENIRKFVFETLEKEDQFFMDKTYTESFVQVAKARGWTQEFLASNSKEAILAKQQASKVATDEALRATFRDYSKLASMISAWEKNGNSLEKLLVSGLLPFKKVPINATKRAVDYSPVGLINGIYDTVRSSKAKGLLPAERSEILVKGIDRIASGLTGTGIMALGMLLAKTGVVVSDDDDEYKAKNFNRDTGKLPYALHIGDSYYSLEWVTPAAIPFFSGVELASIGEKKGANSSSWFTNALDSMTNMLDPFTEMSVVKGISTALSNYASGSQQVGEFFSSAIQGYLGQFMPTILGQTARTIDPVRRNTYTNSDSGYSADWAKFLKMLAAKIPGLSYGLEPSIDRYGNVQMYPGGAIGNFFNQMLVPWKYSKESVEAVDKELEKIYNETNDSSVLPQSPYLNKSFAYDKIKYVLTPEEQTEYNISLGKSYYEVLNKMISAPYYKGLTSEQKAKNLADAMAYSKDIARKKILDKRKVKNDLDGWQANAYEASKKGISISQYIYMKNTMGGFAHYQYADETSIPNGASAEKRIFINSMNNLSTEQKVVLYKLMGVSKEVQAMSMGEVQQALNNAKAKNGKIRTTAASSSASSSKSTPAQKASAGSLMDRIQTNHPLDKAFR